MTTEKICFSLDKLVIEKLRELKQVKAVNLSAFVNNLLAETLKIKGEGVEE